MSEFNSHLNIILQYLKENYINKLMKKVLILGAGMIVTSGIEPKKLPKETYYRYWMHMEDHMLPAHFGIRTKDYKLIFYTDPITRILVYQI